VPPKPAHSAADLAESPANSGQMADFDIAIIGGGIHGTGLAREPPAAACACFWSRLNDLGSGTSSASSKLIHGACAISSSGAFRLVREA